MDNNNNKKELAIQPVACADAHIARLLGMLQDTRKRTLRELENASQEDLDRQLPNLPNSINTLLYHIAAIEVSWLYDEVLQADFPPALHPLFPIDVRDEEGQLTRLSGTTLGEHLQRLEQVRAALLDAFSRMTLADLQRPRSLPDYDVTPEWVLHHLMQHEAEHRGHISALLAGR